MTDGLRRRHKTCSALTGTSSVRLVSLRSRSQSAQRPCQPSGRLALLVLATACEVLRLQFGGWNHLGQSLLSTLLEDVRAEGG